MWIQTFIPWILYGVIAGSSTSSDETAAIVALISTVVCCFRALQKKFILEWCTLIYFVLLCILYFTPLKYWLNHYAFVLSNAALALIMWGSIVIKMPFTIQYAQLQVDELSWQTPAFKFINYMIAIVWALALTVMTTVSLLQATSLLQSSWLINTGYGVPLFVAILFTRRFPDWYKRRLSK